MWKEYITSRGGRLPLREENMIVDYVDTACQELKIKDADESML